VDGVRDELWCTSPNLDCDDWFLRKVIVECKHRMRRAYSTPPLYDQLQACLYCMMYGVEEADLIQVLRKPKALRAQRNLEAPETKQKSETKQKPEADEKSDEKTDMRRRIDDYFRRRDGMSENLTVDEAPPLETATSTVEPEVVASSSESQQEAATSVDAATSGYDKKRPAEQGQPGEARREEKAKARNVSSVEIVVNRVSLNDPIMCHAQNWSSLVLPRLRSFVDAVYKVRRTDELRYIMLYSVSDPSGSRAREGWDVLHNLCGWLKDCDTAFCRLPLLEEHNQSQN